MATYDPDVFSVASEDAAKRIIVTPEHGMTTDQRWQRETPYLAELIGGKLGLSADMLVLDYGCGIGRIAKALIERFGCRVLGVDISQDMRRLAPEYVGSPGFSVVSNQMLASLVRGGLRVEAAYSAWVIQHCLAPSRDLGHIRSALSPGGKLGIINNIGRAVPTKERGWVHDGLDVRQLLRESFVMREELTMDPENVGHILSRNSFWGLYERASG